MRAAPRIFGRAPKRIICRIEKVPLGANGGCKQVMTLNCGHTVEHLQRNDLKVGKKTRCEDCR
jgi:hypothetical protein